MPVVVAVVLIGIPLGLRFRGIVDAAVVAGGLAGQRRVGCDDGAAFFKVQAHVALEMDGEAEVHARREEDYAAAGICGGFNGAVDGGRVDGFAIAGCAEGADVEEAVGLDNGDLLIGGGEGDSGHSGCGHPEATGAEKVATQGIERIHK